jgi:hydroxyacylglutathione hydrolase
MNRYTAGDAGTQTEEPWMIVERIWTGNAYRNFNYLIACPENGEALAIDPLDHGKCLATAKARGWDITQILNTHEHHDHTGGNEAVVAATGAKVVAHHRSGSRIAGVDRGVAAGDVIKVGRSVELECMDTPGHTMCHICLRSHTERPALFSGDTLFNAGAGNCHNGGDPEVLYATFVEQLARLPEETQVYPGHDYIENNLKFTLAREPDNAAAKALLPAVTGHDPATAPVTTLGEEKQFNAFFRLTSPGVIAKLRESFPDLPEQPDAKTVFVRLRELRNKW